MLAVSTGYTQIDFLNLRVFPTKYTPLVALADSLQEINLAQKGVGKYKGCYSD